MGKRPSRNPLTPLLCCRPCVPPAFWSPASAVLWPLAPDPDCRGDPLQHYGKKRCECVNNSCERRTLRNGGLPGGIRTPGGLLGAARVWMDRCAAFAARCAQVHVRCAPPTHPGRPSRRSYERLCVIPLRAYEPALRRPPGHVAGRLDVIFPRASRVANMRASPRPLRAAPPHLVAYRNRRPPRRRMPLGPRW